MPNRRNPNQPLKIMLTITKLGVGGAESQVRDLALSFRRQGSQVDVVTLISADAHIKELAAEGIAVHSLGMESPLNLTLAAIRLVRLYRQLQPDIVHAHCYHANMLCRFSRILAPSVRLICTAHNTFEISRKRGYSSQGIRDAMYRWTDRLSAFNTQVSQLGLERYLNAKLFRQKNSEWVPNGIAVTDRISAQERQAGREALGWPDDAFVWLHAGRLTQAKNQALLIDAFSEVAKLQPNARLAIAGEGDLDDVLKKDVRNRGLEERIEFLGVRTDVPRLMGMADAFVLSSDWEGLPIVLLEAGMAGLPTVATDVGSVGDAVGKTEYLVPPANRGRLVQAMLNLMKTSPEERLSLGSAFRDRIEGQFALGQIVQTWNRIYQQVAKRI